MPQTTTLINAYIDANLLLCLAFFIWLLTQIIVSRTTRRYDFLFQLRLSEGLIVAAVLSPFLAAVAAMALGLIVPQASLSLTDIAVARYLDGQVKMGAVEFETVLSARQVFVGQLAELSSHLGQLVVSLLVMGAGLWALRIFRHARNLRRLIRDSHPWKGRKALEIRISDQISVPFSTRGIFKRYILVPTSLLGQQSSLRITLAHEFQHMRRGDTDWEFMLVLLGPIFFWNPAFHLWKQQIERLRELSCDQVILQRQKVSSKEYADCLLSICESTSAAKNCAHLLTPKVPFLEERRGRKNRFKFAERINMIVSGERTDQPSRARYGLTLAVAVLALSIGANGLKRPQDWSQDRLMLSTIVNLERLELRNSGL